MNSKMKISFILFAIIVILQAITNGSAGSVNQERCFDVLTTLPKNKIQDIYFLKFDQVALTQPAADILSCYIRESHIGDTSISQQLLQVYKKIDSYKRNNVPFGNQQLEELESLGLPYNYEGMLSSKIKAGNTNQVKRELDIVQTNIGNDIQMTRDYKNFKENISAIYDSKA